MITKSSPSAKNVNNSEVAKVTQNKKAFFATTSRNERFAS